jgi:hypothetical protein
MPTGPAEVFAGQFGSGLFIAQSGIDRGPSRVDVPLLVQPSVHRDTADSPRCLQQAERDRQRRAQSLFPSLFTEAAYRGAEYVAQAGRIQRAVAECRDHVVAQRVQLGASYTEPLREYRFGFRCVPSGLQREPEVGRWYEVGAAAGSG